MNNTPEQNKAIRFEKLPNVEPYAKFFTESNLPGSSQVKRMIREVQNELSSAWKFYMGLGADKQVLVLVDGFTALPLSLARNCAHVVIYGFKKAEVTLFQGLAITKQISNYSCVDDLSNLATQFDIILLSTSGQNQQLRKQRMEEVRKFIHATTEIWMIAANEFSLHHAKFLITSISRKIKKESWNDKKSTDRVRLQFDQPSFVKTRQVKNELNSIGCWPFATVGLLPSLVRLRKAQPIMDKRFENLNGVALKGLQKMGAGEIAVGATPSKSTQSFLEQLFHELAKDHLDIGNLISYRISTSGKVLLFVSAQRNSQEGRLLIKLPLNEFTHYRLRLNHEMLLTLSGSAEVGKNRQKYFPKPIRQGSYERQPFFVEDVLSGISGDQCRISKKDRERLFHEIFSFWLSLQQSLARKYYVDEITFAELVEKPIIEIFSLFAEEGSPHPAQKKLIQFLRTRFFHEEINLSLIHGDFSLKNILLDESILTLRGIVDWDLARRAAFPILDLFHFSIRAQRASFKKSPVVMLYQLLSKPEAHPEFNQILKMYQEGFAIEAQILPAYLILYWLQRLSAYLGTVKFLDKRFMQRNFDDALKLFDKFIL